MLKQFGIEVPRHYGVKQKRAWMGSFQYFLIAEEFIRGKKLNSSGEIEQAMGMLARMHSHRRSHWGAATETNPPAHADYLRDVLKPRVMTSTRTIRRWYEPRRLSEFSERLWDLFEEAASPMLSDGGLPYRLIHGDVTLHNFIAADEGVRMLDLVTVRYDLPASEIIQSILLLTRKQVRLQRPAWRAYFDQAGPARWEEFLDQSRLALMCHGLRELSKNRAMGLGVGVAPPKPDSILDWIRELARCSDQIWGNHPTNTDFDRLSTILYTDCS